ncbi:hypothetical protein ACRCPG_07395 [Pseudomonas aeruginosa]
MNPIRAGWLRPPWLLIPRPAQVLRWPVVLVVPPGGAQQLGLDRLGSVAGWERWLAAASGYFLVWRLCVYAATAYGWFWMRRRVLAREDQTGTDGQARRRLIRTEVAGVVAIVALETSLLMQAA